MTLEQKLALRVAGWGALTALSFFFHVVAFIIVLLLFAREASMFKFIYENSTVRQEPHDPTDRYEQLIIPGTEDTGTFVGSERESSLRTHVPENNGRWI